MDSAEMTEHEWRTSWDGAAWQVRKKCLELLYYVY